MGLLNWGRARPASATIDRRLESVRGMAASMLTGAAVMSSPAVDPSELRDLKTQFPELVTADFTTLFNRNSKGLGDFSRETAEMRRLYRDYVQSEPTVKSALVGKMAAVIANEINVTPQNDDDPQERAEADFVKTALGNVQGGISIALAHFTLNCLIDGWALSEKLWAIGEHGALKGRWYIRGLKTKDTANLKPVTDAYRNLVGIESSKDGNETFDPSAFLRMAYLPFFEAPTGTSDLRAAVSYVQFKQQAIKLRMIYLDKFTGPFIHAEWADKNDKSTLLSSLTKGRASGVIVTRAGTKINILDLAAKGTADFKAAIEDIDKMIVVSIHGAFLHMMEGNVKDARGDTKTQERTTKGFQWLLSEYVRNAVREHLAADLIAYNFGNTRPVPFVDTEAVDPAAVLANLAIDKQLQDMGLKLSRKQLYRASGRTPPVDDADSLLPPVPMMPGMGMGGLPGQITGQTGQPGTPGQNAPVASNPLLQAVGGATSLTDLQTAFGRGEISREAAINNAQIVFGLDQETAERLFILDPNKPIVNPDAKSQPAPGGGGSGPFDQGKAAPVAKLSEGPQKFPVADIRIDPERFQFRRNKDGESGTVKSRKIEALDPATVKPLLLWLDPADGLTYLIDGHHRVEAAKAQGVAELPAEFIQAADAEEAKRIGKEANRLQDAAKHAEPKPLPVVKPAESGNIALAGKDGKAAAGLMQKCIDEGKAALELVTRSVAERSLKAGKASPFTEEERKLIQDTLASTLATSELLGRSRVRERATKAEAAGGLFKLSEEVPFSTFAEIPRFGGFEPLPPVQAANYFNSLIPTLNVDPRELAAGVERQAFTLSAATEDVILRRVQDSLGSNLIGGGRSGGFQAVQSILDAAGVSPANPQYAEMVYRTNMMDAYNVGAEREMQTDDMQDMFPVWQYLGIDDGRQGSDHAPKFNRYYPSSASFAEVRGDRPYNCVLPGATVQGRFAGGFKSFYRGEAVEIQMRNGNRLSLTVNHPVLTDSGFVAAGLLKKGQRLASYVGESERGILRVNDQHAPALIEEVFQSLLVSLSPGNSAERVVPSAFDFHGDETSLDGYVEVVDANVKPVNQLNTGGLQGGSQSSLRGPNVLLTEEPCQGALGLDAIVVLHPSSGGLGRGDLGESLGGVGNTRPLQLLRIGGGSRLDANRNQSPNDGGTGDLELFGQLVDRFPALVAGDEIVHINRFLYAGHVYDLATDVGYFIADGIIISNCRCTANPIDKFTWLEDLKPAGAVLETSW